MYINELEEVQISSDEKVFKEIPLTEEPRQLREVAEYLGHQARKN